MSVEQQVFGLEIAVNDVHAMKIIECQRDFSGVKFRDRIWKALWS